MLLKDPQLLKEIQQKACQSIAKFRISAFGINRKGECVAKACNQSRFVKKGGGTHAEMKIMLEARRKRIKTIIICRVGRGGAILPIEPCSVCAEKAKELGIKIISVKE
jgi:cytidine deaminase